MPPRVLASGPKPCGGNNCSYHCARCAPKYDISLCMTYRFVSRVMKHFSLLEELWTLVLQMKQKVPVFP